MSNSKTRYEISICYTDRKGEKRYVNNIGNLWFDGERGSIQLPPGVALVGGGDYYINVSLPRPRDGESGQRRPQQGRGPAGGYPEDDSDGIPF